MADLQDGSVREVVGGRGLFDGDALLGAGGKYGLLLFIYLVGHGREGERSGSNGGRACGRAGVGE